MIVHCIRSRRLPARNAGRSTAHPIPCNPRRTAPASHKRHSRRPVGRRPGCRSSHSCNGRAARKRIARFCMCHRRKLPHRRPRAHSPGKPSRRPRRRCRCCLPGKCRLHRSSPRGRSRRRNVPRIVARRIRPQRTRPRRPPHRSPPVGRGRRGPAARYTPRREARRKLTR